MPITRIKQIFLHLAWTSPSSFEGLDKYLGRLDTIMNGDFKELWERNTDTSERRFSLLKSIEFRSHCSFPLKFSISLCLLKWLQCSEFKWTQLGPKLQLNLNVITNRSLRLPQVSFHFRTLRCLTDFAEQSWNVQINFQGKPESPSRVCWISNHR